MLYALTMAVIFSMILSFYLSSLVDNQKHLLSQKDFLCAQLMAKMTRDTKPSDDSGQIRFDKGLASYTKTSNTLKITILLENSHSYQFELPNVVE